MPDLQQKIADRLKDPQQCTDIPAAYWTTFNGMETPTDTTIYSPGGGNGWVCYEWSGSGNPPTLTLYTNDDGNGWNGQVLETGQTTFQTDNNFWLYYDNGSSPEVAIKLGYAVS